MDPTTVSSVAAQPAPSLPGAAPSSSSNDAALSSSTEQGPTSARIVSASATPQPRTSGRAVKKIDLDALDAVAVSGGRRSKKPRADPAAAEPTAAPLSAESLTSSVHIPVAPSLTESPASVTASSIRLKAAPPPSTAAAATAAATAPPRISNTLMGTTPAWSTAALPSSAPPPAGVATASSATTSLLSASVPYGSGPSALLGMATSSKKATSAFVAASTAVFSSAEDASHADDGSTDDYPPFETRRDLFIQTIKQMGLKQKQVAEELGISTSFLSEWKNGNRVNDTVHTRLWHWTRNSTAELPSHPVPSLPEAASSSPLNSKPAPRSVPAFAPRIAVPYGLPLPPRRGRPPGCKLSGGPAGTGVPAEQIQKRKYDSLKTYAEAPLLAGALDPIAPLSTKVPSPALPLLPVPEAVPIGGHRHVMRQAKNAAGFVHAIAALPQLQAIHVEDGSAGASASAASSSSIPLSAVTLHRGVPLIARSKDGNSVSVEESAAAVAALAAEAASTSSKSESGDKASSKKVKGLLAIDGFSVSPQQALCCIRYGFLPIDAVLGVRDVAVDAAAGRVELPATAVDVIDDQACSSSSSASKSEPAGKLSTAPTASATTASAAAMRREVLVRFMADVDAGEAAVINGSASGGAGAAASALVVPASASAASVPSTDTQMFDELQASGLACWVPEVTVEAPALLQHFYMSKGLGSRVPENVRVQIVRNHKMSSEAEAKLNALYGLNRGAGTQSQTSQVLIAACKRLLPSLGTQKLDFDAALPPPPAKMMVKKVMIAGSADGSGGAGAGSAAASLTSQGGVFDQAHVFATLRKTLRVPEEVVKRAREFTVAAASASSSSAAASSTSAAPSTDFTAPFSRSLMDVVAEMDQRDQSQAPGASFATFDFSDALRVSRRQSAAEVAAHEASLRSHQPLVMPLQLKAFKVDTRAVKTSARFKQYWSERRALKAGTSTLADGSPSASPGPESASAVPATAAAIAQPVTPSSTTTKQNAVAHVPLSLAAQIKAGAGIVPPFSQPTQDAGMAEALQSHAHRLLQNYGHILAISGSSPASASGSASESAFTGMQGAGRGAQVARFDPTNQVYPTQLPGSLYAVTIPGDDDSAHTSSASTTANSSEESQAGPLPGWNDYRLQSFIDLSDVPLRCIGLEAPHLKPYRPVNGAQPGMAVIIRTAADVVEQPQTRLTQGQFELRAKRRIEIAGKLNRIKTELWVAPAAVPTASAVSGAAGVVANATEEHSVANPVMDQPSSAPAQANKKARIADASNADAAIAGVASGVHASGSHDREAASSAALVDDSPAGDDNMDDGGAEAAAGAAEASTMAVETEVPPAAAVTANVRMSSMVPATAPVVKRGRGRPPRRLASVGFDLKPQQQKQQTGGAAGVAASSSSSSGDGLGLGYRARRNLALQSRALLVEYLRQTPSDATTLHSTAKLASQPLQTDAEGVIHTPSPSPPAPQGHPSGLTAATLLLALELGPVGLDDVEPSCGLQPDGPAIHNMDNASANADTPAEADDGSSDEEEAEAEELDDRHDKDEQRSRGAGCAGGGSRGSVTAMKSRPAAAAAVIRLPVMKKHQVPAAVLILR